MRKLTHGQAKAAGALLLAAAILLPGARARSQTGLKVVSFNIHGMAPGSDPSTRLDNATASGIAVHPTGVNSMTAMAMSLKVPTSIADEERFDGPAASSLSQNYPNPFNPATTVEFRIKNSDLVTLKVYDLLGREVAVLVHEVKNPGTYAARFDGSRLVSGVYCYRLTAGGSVLTRKMLLLR